MKMKVFGASLFSAILIALMYFGATMYGEHNPIYYILLSILVYLTWKIVYLDYKLSRNPLNPTFQAFVNGNETLAKEELRKYIVNTAQKLHNEMMSSPIPVKQIRTKKSKKKNKI